MLDPGHRKMLASIWTLPGRSEKASTLVPLAVSESILGCLLPPLTQEVDKKFGILDDMTEGDDSRHALRMTPVFR